jgi:hypothetical protein
MFSVEEDARFRDEDDTGVDVDLNLKDEVPADKDEVPADDIPSDDE